MLGHILSLLVFTIDDLKLNYDQERVLPSPNLWSYRLYCTRCLNIKMRPQMQCKGEGH